MLRTAEKQARAGHSVAVLGANPDRSALPETVITFGLDVPDYHSLHGIEKVRAARNVLWSKPSAQLVKSALETFEPEVVHLHNYAHQLSSSILSVIRDKNVPTVYTAHDYKLVCPAYVANVEGKDCFSCATKLSPRLVQAKCHHDSLIWSSVVGLEAILVRGRRLVPDVLIAPSKFMEKSLKGSWLGESADIRMVRNPVSTTEQEWIGSGDYLLYVGRLSREKGVNVLVKAAAALRIPLKIAGDGPLREELEGQVRNLGSHVEFLGHIGQDDLAVVRQHCRAQVVSSTWPENAPLSALEAAAEGVPLVVSARGGLPEFVKFGARAVVLNDFGAAELGNALQSLSQIHGDLERFREATSWERHLSELNGIYSDSKSTRQG